MPHNSSRAQAEGCWHTEENWIPYFYCLGKQGKGSKAGAAQCYGSLVWQKKGTGRRCSSTRRYYVQWVMLNGLTDLLGAAEVANVTFECLLFLVNWFDRHVFWKYYSFLEKLYLFTNVTFGWFLFHMNSRKMYLMSHLGNSWNSKCHMSGFFFHELIQGVSFERQWKVFFFSCNDSTCIFILLFEKKL